MIEVCLHATRKVSKTILLAVSVTLVFILYFAVMIAPLSAGDNKEEPPHIQFIPVVVQPGVPEVKRSNAVALVNRMRSEADLPPVQASDPLNDNCFEHARYMAKNNVLAHEQDPNLPFASESGQSCAQNANAWLGHSSEDAGWTPSDSVDVWMNSVGHRLWLLYPTTQTVGYGFFETSNETRAAAAIDVLSSANFEADLTYGGWPVQYPLGDLAVPSTRYPITLNWRYFGPQPDLKSTRLETGAGQPIAHEANTNLPAGHKGIQIIPKQDLPPHSVIKVTVSGDYEGRPFSYSWEFRTGK